MHIDFYCDAERKKRAGEQENVECCVTTGLIVI